MLKEAGLTAMEIGKLQEMPWKDYLALTTKAQQKLAAEPGMSGGGLRRGFSPVVDGVVLPQHPYDPAAAPTAAGVPMIICSTFHEQSPSWTDAALETITMDQVVERLKQRAGFGAGFGDKAQDVVKAYAAAFPGLKPVEIWALASSNRQSAVALADRKSVQPAPVYIAWFGWQPPLFDNRLRAFHCLDISFWFYNTDLMWSHTGGGARPRKLSAQMAALPAAVHEDGRSERQGPDAVAQVRVGDRRRADSRRQGRDEERSRSRGEEGAATLVGPTARGSRLSAGGSRLGSRLSCRADVAPNFSWAFQVQCDRCGGRLQPAAACWD